MKNFRNTGYKVTKEGNVFTKRGKIKLIQHVNGYAQLMLYINKKMTFLYVHRIVAELYLPNPDNLQYVRHKDGNKFNNHVDNLEWGHMVNLPNRNYRGDISKDIVDAIRERYQRGEKQQVLADEFNVSQSYISNLVNRRFRL